MRATILAVVDPFAQVLRPLRYPHFVSAAVLLWTGGAGLAALATWGVRLASLLHEGLWQWRLIVLATVALLVSALASTALVSPHAGLTVGRRALAAMGSACMFGLVWCYWTMQRAALGAADPYSQVDIVSGSHERWRAVFGALAIGALLALRPNARLLAARSLLMRMGQVDRQTMRSLAFAVLVGMAGDGVRLAEPWLLSGMGLTVRVLGLTLIVVSSLFVTLGLVEMFRDAMRIAPVLRRRALALSDVIESSDRGEVSE